MEDPYPHPNFGYHKDPTDHPTPHITSLKKTHIILKNSLSSSTQLPNVGSPKKQEKKYQTNSSLDLLGYEETNLHFLKNSVLPKQQSKTKRKDLFVHLVNLNQNRITVKIPTTHSTIQVTFQLKQNQQLFQNLAHLTN